MRLWHIADSTVLFYLGLLVRPGDLYQGKTGLSAFNSLCSSPLLAGSNTELGHYPPGAALVFTLFFLASLNCIFWLMFIDDT